MQDTVFSDITEGPKGYIELRRNSMADIDYFDALIKELEVTDDDVKELSKAHMERIAGWLDACKYYKQASELRFRFLGLVSSIGNQFRNPLV